MRNLIILVTLLNVRTVGAAPVDFESIWDQTKATSPVIAQVQHLLNAAQLASRRTKLAWLPSLSFGAKAYETNDPADVFFSDLSQRQINVSDFTPSTLNQPGRHLFERFSLGLDLPLYEGGRRLSEIRAQNEIEILNSKQKELTTIQEYVEAASAYCNLGSVKQASERLKSLAEQVTQVLSKYSIGSQANPVGYTGLLGLKSLKNRVLSELFTMQANQEKYLITLSEKTKTEVNSWEPKIEPVLVFLDRVVPVSMSDSVSLMSEVALARANAFEEMKNAEKSGYLPKLGIFADESLTHGDRDTGTSYAAGLYLQWSLFSPDHLGKVTERNELKLAADAEVDQAKQVGNIAKVTLAKGEALMKKNLELLNDSEKLLSEQVKVTSNLFHSGAITALQLAEVLNRRVDLILNLRTLEQGLIDLRTKRLTQTHAEGIHL